MPSRKIYICRVCHSVDQRPTTCHPGKSVQCDIGDFGDERSRPLFDKKGNLVTRAPKWWVDACMDEAASRKEQGDRA
ncbi:MAG: hypothetical protein M1570_14535 [Chloroflexi bacterium]|nr:hypothetical protein [Chloroflexota bacterium]